VTQPERRAGLRSAAAVGDYAPATTLGRAKALRKRAGLAAILAAVVASGPAGAEGDFAQRAERLEPLLLDAADGFSWTEQALKTGVYYRWRVESDGREKYKLVAPDLFANSWVHQVSIEDREVKAMGLHAIEFDSAGAIDIWFVPLRPGDYAFSVEGFESDGFLGSFAVE
jgi:hypothetical protein